MLSRYFAMHLSNCVPRLSLPARPCILPHLCHACQAPHSLPLTNPRNTPVNRIKKDAHRRPPDPLPPPVPGGDEGTRTPVLCLAKAPLSRLSYIPPRSPRLWAREDSNFRPHAYQACALTS